MADRPAPRHRCRLEVFADYFQFYVWDPVLSRREAPADWSQQDLANRAKAAEGVVVICPVRNMRVPVEIGLWDREPEVRLAAWQHALDAPLVTRGIIEVHECTGSDLAAFSVEPGDYTIRVLCRGLDTLSEDGLDGEDFYELQIWKARCSGLAVLKRWG